ncbi:hypothetical protein BVG16_29980 [Paenibacillus selenitireducens]|uniref:Uncharacterized protein n=1 Tax=Paenibacillus selenitireducens TaxID=1324314 RepID=A0A1T2WZX3_9BACL|nr:hypothetical protein BVG16_29980 [Paenibacillus selenitireducens]
MSQYVGASKKVSDKNNNVREPAQTLAHQGLQTTEFKAPLRRMSDFQGDMEWHSSRVYGNSLELQGMP